MFVVGVVCALLIGVSLGLLGGGGSILTVLILLHVFQLPPRVAIATSLLVVGSTSAAALVPHALAGRVRWKTGALFGAASMAGAYAAGRAAKHLPASALLTLFGAMMLVTATAMLRGRKPADGAAGRATPTDLPVARALAVGLALGAVTGLVGAGGGFLVVPALMLLGGLPMGVAVGTSLLVITLNAFAGLAGYLASVAIPWGTAGAVVAAAVLGSVAGARLVGLIPAERLRAGFAWLVVAMGVLTLGQEIPRLFGWRLSLTAHWPWLLAAAILPPAVAALVRAARRPPLAA
jgi:uncharacterized membrane protein YfcA